MSMPNFERWAHENEDFDLTRLPDNSGYVADEAQYAWQIWLAATKAATYENKILLGNCGYDANPVNVARLT